MAFIRQDGIPAKQYEPGLFGFKLIDGSMGSQHVALLRGWLKPGFRHAPHTHDVEEAIVFIGGRGVQEIGGEVYDVGPGDAVHVPPGVVHSTLNTGDEDLWFVAAYPDNVITSNPPQTACGEAEWSPLRHRVAWVLRRIASRLSPRR